MREVSMTTGKRLSEGRVDLVGIEVVQGCISQLRVNVRGAFDDPLQHRLRRGGVHGAMNPSSQPPSFSCRGSCYGVTTEHPNDETLGDPRDSVHPHLERFGPVAQSDKSRASAARLFTAPAAS